MGSAYRNWFEVFCGISQESTTVSQICSQCTLSLLTAFWYFQWVEKGYIGNEWINMLKNDLFFLLKNQQKYSTFADDNALYSCDGNEFAKKRGWRGSNLDGWRGWRGSKKRHGFKGVAILSYSLENTASSIKYDLIVPIQFNKLYSFPLSHLVYFVLLLSKWNWPVWDTYFRFIFKFVLSCLFLKLWLSLLLNVQNNEKNYEGAESEDT